MDKTFVILYIQNQSIEELQLGGHPSDVENEIYVPCSSAELKNVVEIRSSWLVFLDTPSA